MSIISYLVRSKWIGFYFQRHEELTISVTEVLGYPKHQEIFWYLVWLLLPLATGVFYGLAQRAWRITSEGGLWFSLAIFLILTPLLGLRWWPGYVVAALHISVLIIVPVATGRFLKYQRESSSPPSQSSYTPKPWLAPLLLLLFAGIVTHGFISLSSIKVSHLLKGAITWSVLISFGYILLFRVLRSSFALEGSNIWERVTWGLLPVVLLPLYQLGWGRMWIFFLLFFGVVLVGAVFFIRPPGRNAAVAAMILLPLGIGMAHHLSPIYRFAFLDQLHEGQHLAYAQCVLRGMLPGVETAVNYGPLKELFEGWLLSLFGAQMSVLRMYFLWAQVLGFWFGCLVLMSIVTRRWIVAYGWMGYLVFSIAGIFSPGRFNGLRVGLPMLALFFWSRRCRGGGAGWLLAAGALWAAGAVYSVEFGLAGLLAMTFGLLARGVVNGAGGGVRTVLQEGAGLVAGASIIFVPLLSLYAMRGGVLLMLSNMYEHISVSRMGYATLPFPPFPWLDDEAVRILGMGLFRKRILFYVGPFINLCAGVWLLGRYLSGRWTSEDAVVTALWIFALVSFRSAMGSSDFMHLIQAVAPSFVLAFVIADRLLDVFRVEMGRSSGTIWSWALPALCSIALLSLPVLNKNLFIGNIIGFAKHHIHKDIGQIEAYYSKRGFRPLRVERTRGIWARASKAERIEKATNFLLQNTRREERQHISSLNAIYFFLADRIPVTRYPLSAAAVSIDTRMKVVEKLEREKPEMIFIRMGSGMYFSYHLEHPEEIEFIGRNYKFLKKAGTLDVYIRKDISEVDGE